MLPSLNPGDILVLNNASVHSNTVLPPLFQANGVTLLFLPPYSPDLNPLELAWSKVKTSLRAAAARTYEQLIPAIADAFRSLFLHDILGYFRHCGYG